MEGNVVGPDWLNRIRAVLPRGSRRGAADHGGAPSEIRIPGVRAATLLCLAACLVATGCGLDQVRTAVPPSEETCASLGTVAVVPARYPPEPQLDLYAEGRLRGAALGMAGGFVVGLWVCSPGIVGGYPPMEIASVLALCGAVGGLLGAVWGAQQATPSREAATLHAEAAELLHNPGASERLAFRVQQLASGGLPQRRIQVLPEAGPTAPSERVDYRRLREQGFESVLAVSVLEIEWSPKGPAGARVNLRVLAQALIYRVVDGETLYQETHRLYTREYPVEEWRAGGNALVREELVPVESALAQRVVDHIFGRCAASR